MLVAYPGYAAVYWLTYKVNFFAGLPIYILLVVFIPHFALARHTLRESAVAQVRLMKRHAVALGINGLLCSGAAYGAGNAYHYFLRYWTQVFPTEAPAAIAAIIYLTLTNVVFAAWSMALYGSLRERLEDQPVRTAAVFD